MNMATYLLAEILKREATLTLTFRQQNHDRPVMAPPQT